jgi:hypothetical protein
MPDDQKLQGLVRMYETAIADLRSLNDRGVDAFIARLEAHQDEVRVRLASSAQPVASRFAKAS